MATKVEVGEREGMQLSKGYRLEYGDSKHEIPQEVVFSEEGESLRLDLKSDEDIKSLVENCSGGEGTYLDEVQEDNVAEKPEISLEDQPRISDKDVDEMAAASVIIPLRDAPNEEDVDNLKRPENGSFGLNKQGLGESVEIEGDAGGEDQQNRDFGHTIPGSTPKKTSGSGVKYETETEACLSVSPVKRDDNDDGTKFHKSEVLVDMSFSPGHTIPGSTPKKTSGSGVKYETETEACLSVSPVKRDDNDDGTKFHKSEVLVDMSFSPGFLWKTLRILFLIGTFSVVVVNVACGKIIHIQAENNVDILHKNGMDLSQTVLNVIHHEVKERSTNEKTKSIIHVHVYKTLEAGEECSAGTQAIQDKCNNSEQALCVRNRTKKNLVAVCAPDMYMHDFCPVFTLATSNGSTFPIVQLDSHSQCVNCSDYYKRDVEKYPQCVKLEMDESTPATSSSNATSYSAGRDEKGLSGGHIAAIVTVAIVVLAVIIVVALFFLHRSGYIHIQSERLCQIWGQIRGWIFVNEN